MIDGVSDDDEGGSDGDVEIPQLEEIEDESVRVKKPMKRTTFRSRKMMGNTIYRGGDRIRPVNWCYSIVTACMIIIPSFFAVTVVPFDMAGWIGGTFVCFIELSSLIVTLRTLYKCATVEPGIIPKIKSKAVNYQKTYKVTYRSDDEKLEVMQDLTPVQAFFSLRNFKLVIEPAGNEEQLPYCRTC